MSWFPASTTQHAKSTQKESSGLYQISSKNVGAQSCQISLKEAGDSPVLMKHPLPEASWNSELKMIFKVAVPSLQKKSWQETKNTE